MARKSAKRREVELDHYIKRLNPEDESDRSLMGRVLKQSFEMDTQGTTQCGCGKPLNPVNSFRCVYCGTFLCVTCAEIHFGLSREDYDKT